VSRVRSAARAFGAGALAVILAAHVGSPDVFFNGSAGPYALQVVVRPPQVVPGIARVTVRAPAAVHRVSIRPVFWRAGSRGAPSPDETRRLDGAAAGGTFEGSLWLMARGAYSVDVIVDGGLGTAHVLVPVASVATGRLALSPALGALLAALAVVLVAGLVNIVYKAAGESITEIGRTMDPARLRRSRRAAAVSVPILAALLLGGARWWGAVDSEYQRRMYRPMSMALSLSGATLEVRVRDTLYSANGRPLRYVPDHGKLMHLFLVRWDDARAFAHLHPVPNDTSAVPAMRVELPPLPGGRYHAYADVVDETGFERTLVASLTIPDAAAGAARAGAPADRDDAWFQGEASRDPVTRLDDGSFMRLDVVPMGLIRARHDVTLRVTVSDAAGKRVALQPYLGMSAHAVVVRLDGAVYVHLHPMGTVSLAAQDAFLARDRGDTAADGRLMLASEHAMPMTAATSPPDSVPSDVSFPYAFPSPGSYRFFVQVRRNGRVVTGAYAITVADGADAP